MTKPKDLPRGGELSLPLHARRWAVVLAAGDGQRLRSIACSASGRPVPKQFWSPDGDTTMLERTLTRAGRLVPLERIAAVVAEQHRQWWSPMLQRALLPENIVAQPRNCGTAAGILLPLLHIADHDPNARVAILPSDHGVMDEWTLLTALEEAFAAVEARPERLVLLGMPGKVADAGYGWITPVASSAPLRAIRGFVEKPTYRAARRLLGQGALISSFMLVADMMALLALYQRTVPELWAAFSHYRNEGKSGSLSALYATLPSCDFSHDLLTPAVDSLDVLTVLPCGWCDLGTPERVQQYRLAIAASPRADTLGARQKRGEAGTYVLSVAADRDGGAADLTCRSPKMCTKSTLGQFL